MALWDSGLWDTAKWSTIEASLSLTLDGISATGSGTITHSGTIALTLDDVSVVMAGSEIHAGILSVQLADITPSISGLITRSATIAIQLEDITPALSGNIIRSGTASIALADLSVQMTGQHGVVDDFAVFLADLNVAMEGSVIPPAPVSVVTKGGTDKHKKHKNFLNQKDETERDIQKAVNKVFGIEEPSEVEPIEETVTDASPPDFSAQIARLALEAEAKALGQTIEQYQAMLDAERDDEEALLLLL
jgi:hypothetical protein